MNYIGIDIGGTNLKAGLTDENGRLLAVKSMKIREVSDPDVLADTLVTLTEELAAQGGIAVQDIASVGAGIPRRGGHPHRLHRVYLQSASAEHSSAEAVQAAAGTASVCGK